MNAQRLLAHYERIADAPDAIARLRRFILDLAVRGQLVPQDPNDEPASELLKRIAKEKTRTNKRQHDLPEIENPEELGDLPPNWCVVSLIALGSWAIGAGFPKNEQGLSNGPYFFLKVSDMNLPGNEKYITVSNNFIDDEAAGRMRATVHPPGTIIFPKIGGAIATNKRRILTRASAIDNNCLGIAFLSEVDTEWAYLLLTTLDLTRYQAGTAVPALQQGVLERIPVGLPPLAEQQRIVAKVDELMGLCGRLETARAEREATRDRLTAASLARLNAPDPETFQNDARFALEALPALTTRSDQIKQIRQTILNLAVRGKLVPQNPKDELASELLKRIAAEKARLVKAGESRKEKPLPEIEFEEIPFDLPAGWVWERLGNIGETNIGLTYSPQDLSDVGVPVLRSSNIQNGKLDFADLLRVRCEPKQSVMVQDGDLLVCARNGSRALVGKVAIIEGLKEPAAFGAFMAIFRSIANQYLYYFICSPLFRQVIDEVNTTTINQITQNNLRSTIAPIPPLAEQRRIVAKVDELMTLCDRLEVSLSTTDATRRRLLDALLHEALMPGDGTMPQRPEGFAEHG